MTYVVLFVLGVAWTWYLVTWLKNRSEHRGVNSISSFSKHLSVLERTSPGAPAIPPRALAPMTRPDVPRHMASVPGSTLTRSQAQQRRKNILTGLGLASMATLLGAGLIGGPFVWAFVVVLAASAAYLGLLVRTQRLHVERQVKVRYLSTVEGPQVDEPVYLLQHSGS